MNTHSLGGIKNQHTCGGYMINTILRGINIRDRNQIEPYINEYDLARRLQHHLQYRAPPDTLTQFIYISRCKFVSSLNVNFPGCLFGKIVTTHKKQNHVAGVRRR